MLTAAVCSLRNQLPKAEFKIFSLYPVRDEPAKQVGVDIVPLKAEAIVFILPAVSFLHAVLGWIPPVGNMLRKYPPLNELVQADVLLDLSGISFVDGRTVTLVYNICCILPAFLVRTPVVKMSQALGPFKNRFNRFFAKILLGRVTTIYSRGKSTSENLKELGLTNWKQAADLAFLLIDDSKDKQLKVLFPEKGILTIGVSPSQVMSSYCSKAGVKYIKPLASALNSIAAANNARVVIVAHSNLGGDVVCGNNDYQICSQLYELCDKDITTLILEDSKPGELRRIIGCCDVFIASRFHSMISALCTGTPTLVTSWSHKYREVMKEFESEQWILKTDDISEASLKELLNKLILDRKVAAERIRRNLPGVRISAQIQIDGVVTLLLRYGK